MATLTPERGEKRLLLPDFLTRQGFAGSSRSRSPLRAGSNTISTLHSIVGCSCRRSLQNRIAFPSGNPSFVRDVQTRRAKIRPAYGFNDR